MRNAKFYVFMALFIVTSMSAPIVLVPQWMKIVQCMGSSECFMWSLENESGR